MLDQMAASNAVLAGVIAYVYCSHSEQRVALVSRLRALGAQIAPRLGKDVSHVVFSRTGRLSAEQRVQEDAELRALFDRARKVRCRCAMLSASCARVRIPRLRIQARINHQHKLPRRGSSGRSTTALLSS